MKGERLSVKTLADEYGVSTKSISRDIGEIAGFLSDSRVLVGNAELKYAANEKVYYLEFARFLSCKDLFDPESFEKRFPEETAKMREEFAEKKGVLKQEWAGKEYLQKAEAVAVDRARAGRTETAVSEL